MVLRILLDDTTTTSCWWYGDCDGDLCNLGLGADGDGLGVKNEPAGGDKIPANKQSNYFYFSFIINLK